MGDETGCLPVIFAALMIAAGIVLLQGLNGCMKTSPPRPVLTCTGGCTYYGPQQPDPRVEMARVLTGGLSGVVAAIATGDVIKAVAGGSKLVPSNSTHIERVSDMRSDRDHSSEVVRTSESSESVTRVSDTSTTTLEPQP